MIALVGYGYWGKNLARVFRDELKFIVDKSDANLSKAKHDYGGSVKYENNLTNEDCIIIIRTILNKSKKILKLLDQFEINKDMNLTISLAKPPIFWKDKEIIKLQMKNWNPTSIKNLIYKIGEIEFLIKKNINNSLNITTDFLLEHSLQITNN